MAECSASGLRPGATSRLMRRVRIVLAAGLVLMTGAVCVVLSHGPVTVAGTNGVKANSDVTDIDGRADICQPGGTLPRGTTAIRGSLSANVGPAITVRVLVGGRVVDQGSRPPGWGVAETVTVPVKRVPRPLGDTVICTSVAPGIEPVEVDGTAAATRIRTGQIEHSVELRLEYLRPASGSWWSLAPTVARHVGLGHSPSGTWVGILALAVMILVAALATRLAISELAMSRQSASTRPTAERTNGSSRSHPAGDGQEPQRYSRRRALLRAPMWTLRSTPRPGWICALLAVLSAGTWSVITPPFQGTDEPAHFAYVQQLAETGELPRSSEGEYSPAEIAALTGLHHGEVLWHPEVHTISSKSQQQRLQRLLTKPLARTDGGFSGVAASEPPLYYALQVIPYDTGISVGGTLLDSLALMRLVSALMAGFTALFTFLFVREVLPREPWAWTVGGASAALVPLLGFTSGIVNPDAMLFAVCAALFYCLARGFRRGLTPRLAIALGLVVAVGLLTKLNFVGILPGTIVGAILLLLRVRRRHPRLRRLYLYIAAAVAISTTPVCAYVVSNLLSHRPALGEVSIAAHFTDQGHSVLHEISYIWSFYLPRLPGMVNYFPGLSTTRALWFDRSVGLYGWLDTPFPVWVDNAALIPTGLIAALCIRALLVRRSALQARVLELLVYAMMALGLIVLIGADAYLHQAGEGGGWAQPRYLLPLLPLFAIVVALAARGAGRRWGPASGVLIILLFFAHDIFSQLQLVARYYG